MEEKIKSMLKRSAQDKEECCPACTNIENCRAYNENGKTRFPEDYKWSKECCEICTDTTCSQNPFYILALLQKDKNEKKDLNSDTSKDYHEEALQTLLSS